MKRELELWSKVHHVNIIPLIGIARIDWDSNMPAFVSPWMQEGNVMDFIKKNPSFPVTGFLIGIINGLHYLHQYNPEIIHGDLKAESYSSHSGKVSNGPPG